MGYIGLMDCNNFFVSCERLFRPDLVGKPVAVLSSNDGCIVARSQEVKDMGIPMGLPLFQVRQLADVHAVTLFSSNFTLYRDISRRVMEALVSEVGECEVYSIDESFFSLPFSITKTELLAIRARVMQKTGIPVTIGVAHTKTLAKVASKLGKKSDGILLLTPDIWQELAKTYPVEQVWNLGGATAKALRQHGITTVSQFVVQDSLWVDREFGVAGRRLQDELRGLLVYRVGRNSHDVRQSLASTRSFAKSSNDKLALESALAYHVTHIAEKLREKKLVAGSLIVELRPSRHGDFAYRGGSLCVELVKPSNTTSELLKAALGASDALYETGVPYKKAGVTAVRLSPESFLQQSLFDTVGSEPSASRHVDSVIDSLNRRFGAGTVRPATVIDNSLKASSTMRSPHYTTTWKDIPTVGAL